jgi:hypothetical protein
LGGLEDPAGRRFIPWLVAAPVLEVAAAVFGAGQVKGCGEQVGGPFGLNFSSAPGRLWAVLLLIGIRAIGCKRMFGRQLRTSSNRDVVAWLVRFPSVLVPAPCTRRERPRFGSGARVDPIPAPAVACGARAVCEVEGSTAIES